MSHIVKAVLLTIAVTYLAINTALMHRDEANKDRVRAVIAQLEQLKASKSISAAEFHDIEGKFTPILYPSLHDLWLLRYMGYIAVGCLFLHSAVLFHDIRKKKDSKELAATDP